ncbi:hypothetical protein BURKHO8Y_520048 [Burkholderia sp. 8Y]|nr:hypothetical protein BURKHO8Y_520048 [Burkholderia sp. 8Y]
MGRVGRIAPCVVTSGEPAGSLFHGRFHEDDSIKTCYIFADVEDYPSVIVAPDLSRNATVCTRLIAGVP